MSQSDLPLIKDLLKSHICKPCKTNSKKEICLTKEEEPLLDKKLQHWKNWINRRKKIHLSLNKMTKREPHKLLMNYSEEFRTLKETKLVLEYSKLAEHTDAEIPEIEYVTVPEKILEEKNVAPRTRNVYTSWAKCAYLKNRVRELHFEMNKVQPHKPDLREVFIEGIPLHCSKKVSDASNINTTNLSADEKEIDSAVTTKVRLEVNDCIMYPSSKNVQTRKVHIMFDYDITTHEVATEYLILKNTGDYAIHYNWRVLQMNPLFSDIMPQVQYNTSYFYFNKNKGVITPNKTLSLPIWFKIEKPGVYCENWELLTKPKVLHDNSKLVIVFHASAVRGDLEEKIEQLRNMLDKNIRARLIRESLRSNTKLDRNKFKPTIYCYNKKEVFEAISATYDPIQTFPRYAYNRDVVRELQKLYKSVRRSKDPKVWNYDIYELKVLTNIKQKEIDAQNQQAELEVEEIIPLLECENIDFSNSFSKTALRNKSKQEIKSFKTNVHDKFTLTELLETILAKLESPTFKKNTQRMKYVQVYLQLCTCFDKIENEIVVLQKKLEIFKNVTYPNSFDVHIPSQEFEHECSYNVYCKPPIIENTTNANYHPIPKCIEEIPANEITLKYKTYYKFADSVKDISHKVSVKKESKKKSIDLEDTDGYTVNESFNPYASVELTDPYEINYKSEQMPTIQKSNNSPVMLHHYTHYIYVIVYNHLANAIDNIVDTLEMPMEKNLSYPIIKEIENPNYTKRLIDLKGLLVEENMDNLKAKMILHNYRKHSKLDWKTIEIQRELRRIKSDSSLWSILQSYETKPTHLETKPISYPEEFHEDILRGDVETLHKTTSTSEGEIVPILEPFKEQSTQKDYLVNEEPDDLEAYIEKVKSQTSIQNLIDKTFNKETQKNIDDHVSDEEYFYYVASDSELSDISIESKESDNDFDTYDDLIKNNCNSAK